MIYKRQQNPQELETSRNEAAERLTSDLSIISDWGRRNLVSFSASKTQFLHLSTRQDLPHNYPLFFNNIQPSPSLIPNSLILFFTQKLNWKFHILSLAKSASSRLGVLYRLQPFFPPICCLQSTGALSAPVWSIHAMCGEVQHIQLFWTGWSQRLFVSSDPLLLLVVFYLSILAAVLLLSQSSIAISMLTALVNLLTACLPSSYGLAVHVLFRKLTPILSKPLMQE